MKDAGLHAINVGFAQGYHAAFDAKQCRWVMAWQGDFLDAAATWDDRFTPLTEPEGSLAVVPAGFSAPPSLKKRSRTRSPEIPTF